MISLFESYQIQFSTNIWYSYASGKFKHTGLIILLLPDCEGDEVWMLQGCTENILLIHYFYYKLLLPYYFGLERPL